MESVEQQLQDVVAKIEEVNAEIKAVNAQLVGLPEAPAGMMDSKRTDLLNERERLSKREERLGYKERDLRAEKVALIQLEKARLDQQRAAGAMFRWHPALACVVSPALRAPRRGLGWAEGAYMVVGSPFMREQGHLSHPYIFHHSTRSYVYWRRVHGACAAVGKTSRNP